MNSQNWQTFFDHHAPKYMENCFVTATQAEVDFLVEHLHLQPGMYLLDVGCGTGRHAVEFVRRGYSVTGVDISVGMPAEAQRAVQNAGVAIELGHWFAAHQWASSLI